MNKKSKSVITALILLATIIVTGVFIKEKMAYENAIKTTGEIIDFKVGNGRRGGLSTVKIRFYDTTDKEIILTRTISLGSGLNLDNKRIKIFYPKNNPQKAKVDEPFWIFNSVIETLIGLSAFIFVAAI
ncbi:MAG: hypothetical protein K0R25_1222 [Rickettsiaceae bacterium]|jgi:ribosomal protein S28E/S33|nr:hypothetical protein [Rickettsiaceae bacterium]